MPPRGRRPKPSRLRLIQGNPGKRPINDREPETAGPLGNPPESWTPAQAAIWDELVANVPRGILTRSDRLLVEIAARLLGQIRGNADVNAAVIMQFRACLSEMGMAPGSRTRLLASGRRAGPNSFADLD